MAIKHMIMAALDRDSMHGYGVHEALRDLLGPEWPTSSAHVYATLGELERSEVVSVCPDPSAPRNRRKLFSLTERGRRAVAAWLTLPIACAPLRRSELLAKLAAAVQCGGTGLVEWLRVEREARTRRIARFRREMDSDYARRRPSRLVPAGWDPTLGRQLICARRLRHLRIELDMLDSLVGESTPPAGRQTKTNLAIPAGSASR